jgi:hypothetical protein
MNLSPIVKLDRVIDVFKNRGAPKQAIRFSVIWWNNDWNRPIYQQDGWRLMPGWKVAPPATFGVSGLMMAYNQLDPEFADQLREVLETYDSVLGVMGPWMRGQTETQNLVLEEEKRIVG